MKTIMIIAAYNALTGSKLTKMSGDGKIKVVKIIKAMKPIATDYDDFRKDALERLKPEGYDAMAEKAQQWQKDGENTTLTATERAEINQFFADYQTEVDKCLNDEVNKEHELSFTKLTADEFTALCDGNDWTAGQMLELMDIICD